MRGIGRPRAERERDRHERWTKSWWKRAERCCRQDNRARENEREDAVFTLCPFTVSDHTSPLWRSRPQLPAVNQKHHAFLCVLCCGGPACVCVCVLAYARVSMWVLAICPAVFPSQNQHYWNSFRLGSHFTVLPKKASLLWLSLWSLCTPTQHYDM